MHKNLPHTEERTERRISAATSLSMCALTVIAQIATTLLLTRFCGSRPIMPISHWDWPALWWPSGIPAAGQPLL
jgi:hypothetical protein